MKTFVMIPRRPGGNLEIRNQFDLCLNALVAANDVVVCEDSDPITIDYEPTTPWSKVCAVRNRMVERVVTDLAKEDSVLWIDDDIIQFPADLPLLLYRRDTVVAPMVFIERYEPRAFYDWSAFIYKGKSGLEPLNRAHISGRNINIVPPFFGKESRLHEMDCVGACYMMPARIYLDGVRHTDHPAYTDHFAICEAAGGAIVDELVEVFHANLPLYGETWH